MLKAASVFSNYALTAVVFQFKLFTCPVYAFSPILDQANNILIVFFSANLCCLEQSFIIRNHIMDLFIFSTYTINSTWLWLGLFLWEQKCCSPEMFFFQLGICFEFFWRLPALVIFADIQDWPVKILVTLDFVAFNATTDFCSDVFDQ